MSLLQQIIGFGIIALLILFQPEIRRFFRGMGKRPNRQRHKANANNYVGNSNQQHQKAEEIQAITIALLQMSKKKIGALIVFTNKFPSSAFSNIGIALNAKINTPLLISIFNKESPLHDGAVIIANNLICSASCILPISKHANMPPETSLRHRAGLGISEKGKDIFVLMVSEENGAISFAREGKFKHKINEKELQDLLKTYY